MDNVKELSTNFNNNTEINQRCNIEKCIEKLGKEIQNQSDLSHKGKTLIKHNTTFKTLVCR